LSSEIIDSEIFFTEERRGCDRGRGHAATK